MLAPNHWPALGTLMAGLGYTSGSLWMWLWGGARQSGLRWGDLAQSLPPNQSPTPTLPSTCSCYTPALRCSQVRISAGSNKRNKCGERSERSCDDFSSMSSSCVMPIASFLLKASCSQAGITSPATHALKNTNTHRRRINQNARTTHNQTACRHTHTH